MTLDWVQGELAALERDGLLRDPRTIASAAGPEVEVDGRRLVLLCSNNYLGLAGDARVRATAATAAQRYGAGSGASRLVSGTQEIHGELERALAAHEGAEDVVLFSSGYLANLGVLAALTGPDDVVFSDELNHASIVDGCRLSKAHVVVYRHADVGDLAAKLGTARARRRFVVTDSVFSMDGDLAPLEALVALCESSDATLVTDEAHATGVLGASGGGAVEGLGLTGRVPVIVGTLSKALASAGGYVATARDCATLLRNRARTHVFDTAPPPAAVAAAAKALTLVRTEPWRRTRVRELARTFAVELRSLGFDAHDPAAAIVPVMVGDAREAVGLSTRLFEAGVLCPAIRPPSVAEGTSRLRVTLMATHSDEQIERALDAFARARGSQRARSRVLSVPALDAIARAKGVFVSGTDTGVGKTVVTAAIAKALRERGRRVAIFKPLQTGTIDGADDAAWASRVSGCYAETGVALREGLAPSVAARLEGEDIDLVSLRDRFVRLATEHDVVIVEGAGGLLVGVDGNLDMAGLASMFGLPVVLVARPALGTLNHTALSVEALAARGIELLGVVLSNFPERPGLAERTNPQEISRITELLGVVPALEDVDVEGATLPRRFEPDEWLAPVLGGSFDASAFLGALRDAPVWA